MMQLQTANSHCQKSHKKITASETNRLLHAIHKSKLIIENRTLKPAFQLLIREAYA